MSRTGDQVAALLDAVRADWRDVEMSVREAAEMLAALEVDGRGVNGMAATARGCLRQLEQILVAIERELEELGKRYGQGVQPPPMHEAVDEELAARVVALRSVEVMG